jgi:hypothetical protein
VPLVFFLGWLLVSSLPTFGQQPESPPTLAAPDQPPVDDLSGWNRFWLSGQANFITQYHPTFPAAYSGPNSFLPASERASSRVLTLYTGIRLTKTTDFLFDVEEAGGGGLSSALGIAGFTNLDVVRNPTLGQSPYIARVMFRHIIPLSKEWTEATRYPLGLTPAVPVRRLEIRYGKMSTVDFFDSNSIGSDSHLQFMNWAVDNNGAYDYAADTRGYTYGILVEYYEKTWVLRFGEMLMPKVANGIHLDADIARARAENVELELHRNLLPKREGVIRPLVFINHANMGSYREAIDRYLAGIDPVPDITAVRKQGRIKYGFGLNMEQILAGTWRAYGRLGWNEGANESFAYTEVDRSASFGSDISGRAWHRPQDKVGTALLIDALSGDHRRYLQLGGLGFILGDGNLRYGLETISESYYTFHLWRGVSLSFDLQRVWNPGYNQDRGPVVVLSGRLHLEGAVAPH